MHSIIVKQYDIIAVFEHAELKGHVTLLLSGGHSAIVPSEALRQIVDDWNAQNIPHHTFSGEYVRAGRAT